MKLGVALPLSDIGGDFATVRLFAQAAEAAGYDHLGAPDHVLGVNVASRPGWGARNTLADLFHDPFVLGFSALAPTESASRHRSSSCRSDKPCWSPSKPPALTC